MKYICIISRYKTNSVNDICPHRLEAYDTGFSSRQQGFDSPWGCISQTTSCEIKNLE